MINKRWCSIAIISNVIAIIVVVGSATVRRICVKYNVASSSQTTRQNEHVRSDSWVYAWSQYRLEGVSDDTGSTTADTDHRNLLVWHSHTGSMILYSDSSVRAVQQFFCCTNIFGVTDKRTLSSSCSSHTIEILQEYEWRWHAVRYAQQTSEHTQRFNPFNASCFKLLLFEGFSAMLL